MENTIIEAAKINRLSSENAVFEIKNGFLTMTSKDLDHARVFLHRAFPFDLLWQYISVLDIDQNELGVIYSVDDFSTEQTNLLKAEFRQ